LNRAQVLTLPDSATWRIALGQISREQTNDFGEIRVEFEVESLLKAPTRCLGNDAKVRELLDQSLRGNHMGLNTPRETDGIYLSYNVGVVLAEKV